MHIAVNNVTLHKPQDRIIIREPVVVCEILKRNKRIYINGLCGFQSTTAKVAVAGNFLAAWGQIDVNFAIHKCKLIRIFYKKAELYLFCLCHEKVIK